MQAGFATMDYAKLSEHKNVNKTRLLRTTSMFAD